MSKFSYKFSNLYGAVYRQGNLVFSEDGNCVISPVGNRLSHFDLKNNRSCTFPFENRKNIRRFAVSPDGVILISVDEDGRALIVNLHKKAVLHHFNFKERVYDLKYSPDGRYIAVTHGRMVQVWHAPGQAKDCTPLSLYRSYPGQYDDTLCLDWSDDSRFFAVGSRDMSCRVFSVKPVAGFHYVTLAAHRSAVLSCFFRPDSLSLYTVARDGAVGVWDCSMTLSDMRTHTREWARLKQKTRRRRRREREERSLDEEEDGVAVSEEEEEEDEKSEEKDDVSEMEEEHLGRTHRNGEGPPEGGPVARSKNICGWSLTHKLVDVSHYCDLA
ncbi:Periodic tryptophan protein 2 homolog [Geodia barretti]|uniref:Periodic tryptophan protein 2 homolog n=1 Tax=Geodia barretti TaxID=519541 RepID=A0AA35WJN5_GEOBA|nr:Periodic tryptophan protein 2 homolog [Geodia barretti]